MTSEELLAARQSVVLDRIPVDFGDGEFLHRKAKRLNDARKNELRAYLKEAEAIARPKAIYQPVPIRLPSAGTIEIMGQAIQSPVLYDNLRDLNRAFAYIATCGTELADWKASLTSAVDRFFADLICESALGIASRLLREHITHVYHAHGLASMNPGSTRGWPVEGQRVIFSILADAGERIGVELRESFFMAPTHSGSGILFESEKGYQNCQLCGLVNCPNRQAPFDPRGYRRGNHGG